MPTKTKIKKVKEKRPYSKNLKEKLLAGEDWAINLKIPAALGLKIVNEKENSVCGGEYSTIILNRIMASYKKEKK